MGYVAYVSDVSTFFVVRLGWGRGCYWKGVWVEWVVAGGRVMRGLGGDARGFLGARKADCGSGLGEIRFAGEEEGGYDCGILGG